MMCATQAFKFEKRTLAHGNSCRNIASIALIKRIKGVVAGSRGTTIKTLVVIR
jgi:hypothetical protein